MRAPLAGWVLMGALALPPLRETMEASMAVHMLVQIPLLVLAGWWLAPDKPKALDAWDPYGIAALSVVIFCTSYWMLPRALDAALQSGLVDAAKFASLALLAGVPLRWCWGGLHVLVRGFVWSNLISMVFVFGWLYLAAPIRVCNNYLLDDQEIAGKGFIVIGLLLSLWLTVDAFAGGPVTERMQSREREQNS